MKKNYGCKAKFPKVKAVILVSKYMMKRYGAQEAIKRMIKYNYNYANKIKKKKK
jgi:hypothetical protein